MDTVRYLLLVAGLVAALVGGLRAFSSLDPRHSAPTLEALAAPSSVFRGESVALVGYVQVPAGSFELGTYACQGGSCRRSLWRRVSGPASMWVKLGSVRFDGEESTGAIELRAFELDDVRGQVVGVWRRDVDVLDPGSSSTPSGANPLPSLTARVSAWPQP